MSVQSIRNVVNYNTLHANVTHVKISPEMWYDSFCKSIYTLTFRDVQSPIPQRRKEVLIELMREFDVRALEIRWHLAPSDSRSWTHNSTEQLPLTALSAVNNLRWASLAALCEHNCPKQRRSRIRNAFLLKCTRPIKGRRRPNHKIIIAILTFPIKAALSAEHDKISLWGNHFHCALSQTLCCGRYIS